MDSNAIALLLKRTIGLDPRSIGFAAIERAVQQRALACRLRDRSAYFAYLESSPDELQQLIENVVVPETWFFRDRAAFSALSQWAHATPLRLSEVGQASCLSSHATAFPSGRPLRQSEVGQASCLSPPAPAFPSGRPLRLLSAPCSTGEEPYSMAMTLLESGLAPERFSIDAFDINSRALAQARRGEFGRNSFRGAPLEFRRRYFEDVGTNHRLKSEVPHRIHFEQANLLDEERFLQRGRYDVVFCRNVFIYFDEVAQEKLLRLLRRLLNEDGVLFVGPAESGRLTDHGFVSAGYPGAFAFRKAELIPQQGQRERAERPGMLPLTPRKENLSPKKSESSFATRLRCARELADQARLPEAAQLCQALLQEAPDSADVLCLLGLVRDAEGDTETARALYGRVLYVDPVHAEALLHLALLNDECGDHASARLLHQRAGRLQQKLQP